ncbi:hypothetical protein CTKA_02613 [Chthonomonas calidirosea]|uniref:Uncharacterized protein n=1 Tax=Chthonomonas calidirosea (strain DSM 23976 / ICMP 18418 / T49) TaxID=1303518 RepID=S0EUH1_CHTCT|nr:hypothetical protein [Chthonomonas calidirosea]CCW35302.1 hypothetical protein CCALI_01486 [Chthonomonas calidirosea T49]CEK20665.1 hypothetical protein CTKA_02613 [Chthonomonas calidirosea]
MNNTPHPNSSVPQPRASDLARIQGGGLTLLVVTQKDPLSLYLFLNGREIAQPDVESMTILLQGPNADSEGTIHASLSYYVPSISGGKNTQTIALFPGTVEILVETRRIQISCPFPNTFDGLWVGLGLRPDGSPHELTGLQAFHFLLEGTLLHAELTWVSGETETILDE